MEGFCKLVLAIMYVYMIAGWMWENLGWVVASLLFVANIVQLMTKKRQPHEIHIEDIRINSPASLCGKSKSVQQVDWINKLIADLWPDLLKLASPHVCSELEYSIREYLKDNIPLLGDWGFSFRYLYIGNKPLVVKDLDIEVIHGRCTVLAKVAYDSECKMKTSWMLLPAGMENFKMGGQVKLVMNSLQDITLSFPNNIRMEFDLTGVAWFLDTCQFRETVVETVQNLVTQDIKKFTFAKGPNEKAMKLMVPLIKNAVGKSIQNSSYTY